MDKRKKQVKQVKCYAAFEDIKSVLLCILDGWGNGKNSKYNAISRASKPCWDFINRNYPVSRLSASGVDVGLPKGQIGNSRIDVTTNFIVESPYWRCFSIT